MVSGWALVGFWLAPGLFLVVSAWVLLRFWLVYNWFRVGFCLVSGWLQLVVVGFGWNPLILIYNTRYRIFTGVTGDRIGVTNPSHVCSVMSMCIYTFG